MEIVSTLEFFAIFQIWASDDTDVSTEYMDKLDIVMDIQCLLLQHMFSISNHQTLRNMPLMTRFNVAAFGVFGYEVNLCE